LGRKPDHFLIIKETSRKITKPPRKHAESVHEGVGGGEKGENQKKSNAGEKTGKICREKPQHLSGNLNPAGSHVRRQTNGGKIKIEKSISPDQGK